MHDQQRDFYNAAYPVQGRAAIGGKRLLSLFELHRSDVVLRLLRPGGKLLDIGCGDGHLIAQCAGFFQVAVGVDVADTQLLKAQTRLRSAGTRNVVLVHANVDRGLPFAADAFDAVTCIALLGFVFDPLALLSEVGRVLKSGGVLVLEVLNLGYAPRRLAVLAGGLPGYTSCHGWEGGHLHNFTRSSVKALLERQGYDVVDTTGSGVLAGARSRWPSMLLGNVIMAARKR